MKTNNITAPVVFVSTEDGIAIRLFREAMGALPEAAGVTMIHYKYHRPEMNCAGLDAADLSYNGSGAEQLQADWTAAFTQAHGFGTCPDLRQNAQQHQEDLTMISLLNLWLALEATHIMCLGSSNWCLLLAELRDGATAFHPV